MVPGQAIPVQVTSKIFGHSCFKQVVLAWCNLPTKTNTSAQTILEMDAKAKTKTKNKQAYELACFLNLRHYRIGVVVQVVM